MDPFVSMSDLINLFYSASVSFITPAVQCGNTSNLMAGKYLHVGRVADNDGGFQ